MLTLVTIITATWGRPKTIVERAIPSMARQTYRPLEHIVVTDGFDPHLNAVLRGVGYTTDPDSNRWIVPLGRNWTGFMDDGGQGAIPRGVGARLARGDYIGWLDDDNEFLPNHVANLAAALDAGHDLACCRWFNDAGLVAGSCSPPGVGHTDTSSFMIKAELLRITNWQPDGYEGDGNLVQRWVDAGVKWTLLDEPTMILHPPRRGRPDE